MFSDELSKTMSGPLGYDSSIGFISSLSHDNLDVIMNSPLASFVEQNVQVKKASDEEQNPMLLIYSF